MDIMDFIIIFGMLTILVGGFLFLKSRQPGNKFYTWGSALTLLGFLLLFWINGAVGIIGSEGNPANLMFFAVPLAAILVAVMVRFQPSGMAHAMMVAAFIQILVAVIAIVARLGTDGPIWPKDVVLATLFFTTFWLGSAWLFWKAAQVDRQN